MNKTSCKLKGQVVINNDINNITRKYTKIFLFHSFHIPLHKALISKVFYSDILNCLVYDVSYVQ